MRLAKGLLPLTYLNTLVSRPGVILKARYGVEDTTDINKLYVLNVQSILDHDVLLNQKDLERYRIWRNTATQSDVYLLPNAARMVLSAGNSLQYISDVLTEYQENGTTRDIDVIVPVNDTFAETPIISIGKDGTFNFTNGIFNIPRQAEMELYLKEISGKWLIDSLESGFIRTLVADQNQIHDFIFSNGEMPQGTIVEKLFQDDEAEDGIRLYWIGTRPENVTDPEQMLLFVLLNTKTDEAKAYRISVGMMNRGENPVPVSLYLYRDARSDRMEVEKYNVMFFDTPEGKNDLVKIVTDVLGDRNLEMPRSLSIPLRGLVMEGAAYPAYSISNHLFVLAKVVDGAVNLFDSFYIASFDGDTFESAYTKVEGIRNGEITVTIKKNQPIWPEWTGEDTAEDIGGIRFRLNDGKWEKEVPVKSENKDNGAA